MKLLIFHVEAFEYEPLRPEAGGAEEAVRPGKMGEGLVAFVSVEEGDGEGCVRQAASDLVALAAQLKAPRVLLYPYAHLSNRLAAPEQAKQELAAMEALLRRAGLEVEAAPFGWTKRFTLRIKGHPLAEQFRSYEEGGEQAPRPMPPKKSYYILGPEGELHGPGEFDYSGLEDFRRLVEREALGVRGRGREPRFIRQMVKMGIAWERASDLGHLRYGPEGALMLSLAADYVSQLVQRLEFPVYFVQGTNMFSLDERAIREHAQLFGQRMYQVRVGGRSYVLRYAACFQQFSMIRDWTLSYRHLPFGAFEIADSYRLEQSGELLLGFRVRKMSMPDLHVFCRDLEEAKRVFLELHRVIYAQARELGREYVSLYNVKGRRFLEENRDFFRSLLEVERKPVLVAEYPEDAGYYWLLNIEYHIIDERGEPREIATVQIDVGNAERFGISYTDREGAQKRPVILHSALLGTLERFLFLLFDTALRREPPSLPTWICPTQVRIIPVSSPYVDAALALQRVLEEARVRADVDDRDWSVDRKVREAETAWVPYIIVIGERELAGGPLPVRVREERRLRPMGLQELIERIRRECADKPYRPLTLPRLLSMRPGFA
jgi:threonyl-tRNA synthetase